MSKIDIHNYEAYLLDLSEGKLAEELQVELELFLIQHPELKMDLSELALFTIDTEEINFAGKQQLKKAEQDLVSQEQFVAYIENQLPLNERTELEKSCASNPSLSKELALYTKTIAVADSSIVFENKQSLKRKPKVIWFNFSATQFAAAASVLLLIGLFVLWPKSDDNTLNNHTSLAEHGTQKNTRPLKNAVTKATDPVKKLQKNAPLKNGEIRHNSTANNQQVAVNSLQNSTTTIPANNEMTVPPEKETTSGLATIKPLPETIREEKNTSLLASATKTTVEIITESDDEVPAPAEKKKGIWAIAKRTLKNLNTVGVKSVNGTEEDTSDNTTYALTLGKVQITHKAN